MKAKRISITADALLDPQAAHWSQAGATEVALVGTPVAMQPTQAVRNTWASKTTGAVARVSAAALHNGQMLALRLVWQDPSQDHQLSDTDSFLDAAAVAFPVGKDALIATMGSPQQPINLWYWRADENGRGRQLRAGGIGSSETLDNDKVRGQGVWHEGRWSVVIARAMNPGAQGQAVRLVAGGKTKVGFAVWEGQHQERGGLKGFSYEWTDLQLDA